MKNFNSIDYIFSKYTNQIDIFIDNSSIIIRHRQLWIQIENIKFPARWIKFTNLNMENVIIMKSACRKTIQHENFYSQNCTQSLLYSPGFLSSQLIKRQIINKPAKIRKTPKPNTHLHVANECSRHSLPLNVTSLTRNYPFLMYTITVQRHNLILNINEIYRHSTFIYNI